MHWHKNLNTVILGDNDNTALNASDPDAVGIRIFAEYILQIHMHWHKNLNTVILHSMLQIHMHWHKNLNTVILGDNDNTCLHAGCGLVIKVFIYFNILCKQLFGCFGHIGTKVSTPICFGHMVPKCPPPFVLDTGYQSVHPHLFWTHGTKVSTPIWSNLNWTIGLLDYWLKSMKWGWPQRSKKTTGPKVCNPIWSNPNWTIGLLLKS